MQYIALQDQRVCVCVCEHVHELVCDGDGMTQLFFTPELM